MWDVICLAALSAMEVGRRYLAAQLKRPPVTRAANAELVERAILWAVSDLWARVFGFALLGLPQVGAGLIGDRPDRLGWLQGAPVPCFGALARVVCR